MPIHDIDQYIEFQKKLYKHLDLLGGEIEVILKGYLLIQNILLRILEKSVQATKKIAEARLGYHRLACIVQALHEDRRGDWVWKAVFDLNILRNNIAHRLDSPNIEELIEDFISYVRANGDGTMEAHYAMGLMLGELATAITNIHYELWRLLDDLSE